MVLQTLTLPNGIRLVHHPVSGRVAHCGLFIGAGTRDETPDEHGIAHFIEHTIFKGTRKRNVFQVLNRLENVGADLNAYTSKEDTVIHASFLKEDYERTLELFQDILFHSVFPEKEIAKEKQVVMDEISAYLDTPADQVVDDFEDLVFKGHALGRNILGTKQSVSRFTREDIFGFIRRNYKPEGIVLVSVGDIPFDRLSKWAMRYFDQRTEAAKPGPRRAFKPGKPVQADLRKPICQVHCVLGGPAYPFSDSRRVALALLNNLLGGPILNSRLSLALRERNGLTYQNDSVYIPFSDSGIVSIYFGTDPNLYEKALSVVEKELKRIRTEKLTDLQMRTVRKQLIGQLSIGRESNAGLMLAIGKNYLLQDRFDPLEQIVEAIEATTPDQLLEIANDIFHPGRISRLTFLPA